MARTTRTYRKVECATWFDDQFRSLSAPKPNAQTLWLYLLSGPRTIIIPGVTVARAAVMADDLRWTQRAFLKVLGEIVERGMVRVDLDAGLVVLEHALMHRGIARETAKPNSTNAIKSWVTAWRELPDCALKSSLLDTIRSFTSCCGDEIANAFAVSMGTPYERRTSRRADAVPDAVPTPSVLRMQEQDTGAGDLRAPPRAGARDPAPPSTAPEAGAARPPPVRLVTPDPDPMTTKRRAIMAAIVPLHVQVFNRVRDALSAAVRPMQPVGDPAERALLALLNGLPSLDGVEDDCRHVLAVREAEAMATRSLQYLGASVWNVIAFGRAKTTSLDEAKGRAVPPTARGRPAQSGFAALAAAASTDDEDDDHDPDPDGEAA